MSVGRLVGRSFVRFFDCLEMLNNTQTPLTSASTPTPASTSTAPAMASLGRTTITTSLPKTMVAVAVLALTTQIVFVKVLLSYFVVYIFFPPSFNISAIVLESMKQQQKSAVI